MDDFEILPHTWSPERIAKAMENSRQMDDRQGDGTDLREARRRDEYLRTFRQRYAHLRHKAVLLRVLRYDHSAHVAEWKLRNATQDLLDSLSPTMRRHAENVMSVIPSVVSLSHMTPKQIADAWWCARVAHNTLVDLRFSFGKKKAATIQESAWAAFRKHGLR